MYVLHVPRTLSARPMKTEREKEGYLPSISSIASRLRNSFGVSDHNQRGAGHVVAAVANDASHPVASSVRTKDPSGGSLLAQALRGLSFRKNSRLAALNKTQAQAKASGDESSADYSESTVPPPLPGTRTSHGKVPSIDQVSPLASRRGTAQQGEEARISSMETASPRNSGPTVAAAPGPQFPLTPAGAIKFCRDHLTDYEQSELLDFPQIFYTGKGSEKTKATVRPGNNNHGFDDERGDYKVTVGDHLAYRYEVVEVLGRGSFGQVIKCVDHKTGASRAVKVIRNKKRFHQQALIELKLLEHLRHKDADDTHNVVHMEGYFYFRGHLCIDFEILSINLYELIKNGNFQGLSMSLVRRFAIQILVTLGFLKKHRIVHCDLKPENILLKHPNKAAIKVIDFGSSCYEEERLYTYIQSRFYRSPEVLMGLPYDTAIDMWSFGCIMAELYTGYPLFHGENEVEQLLCIMEIMGLPPREMIEKSTRQSVFFEADLSPKIIANSRGKKRRPATKDLAAILRSSDPVFLDFLQGCLRWDPKERLTPDQALMHEWITEGGRRAPSSHPSTSTPAPNNSGNPQGNWPGNSPAGLAKKSVGAAGGNAAGGQGGHHPLAQGYPVNQGGAMTAGIGSSVHQMFGQPSQPNVNKHLPGTGAQPLPGGLSSAPLGKMPQKKSFEEGRLPAI